MSVSKGHIDHIETEPQRWARKALGIIWVTGVVCALVIIIFFLSPASGGSGKYLTNKYQHTGVSTIDQLLLSSDEALLSDKKSFVNGALRFQWRSQEPDLNQGNNRTILYDNILKKKLQRIPKAQVADFSVRPVPQ